MPTRCPLTVCLGPARRDADRGADRGVNGALVCAHERIGALRRGLRPNLALM